MKHPRTLITGLFASTLLLLPAAASGQDVPADQHLDAKALELTQLDLTPDTIRFTSFAAHKGRSMLLRVERRARKGRKDFKWVPIAVLKTASGSTNPAGEVATYRLSRYLNVHIVPVCVPRYLTKPVMQKLLDTLEELDFSGRRKEKARLKVIDDLKVALEEQDPQYMVALKEWVQGFAILPSKGFEGLPPELKLVEHLDPKGPHPKDEKVTLPARYTGYLAESNYLDVARDVSALVVMDAIGAQHERWTGNNLHFRLTEQRSFKKTEEGTVEGGPARLMTLDNGSSFVSGERRPFDVLKRFVGRFDKGLVRRLYDLYDWVYSEARQARRWLTLDKPSFWRFRRHLARTIQHIDANTDRYGEAAWFEKIAAD